MGGVSKKEWAIAGGACDNEYSGRFGRPCLRECRRHSQKRETEKKKNGAENKILTAVARCWSQKRGFIPTVPGQEYRKVNSPVCDVAQPTSSVRPNSGPQDSQNLHCSTHRHRLECDRTNATTSPPQQHFVDNNNDNDRDTHRPRPRQRQSQWQGQRHVTPSDHLQESFCPDDSKKRVRAHDHEVRQIEQDLLVAHRHKESE